MLSSSSQPEGSPTEWGYVGCCSPARGCGLESWGCCWGRGEVEMGDTGAGCPLSHPTLSHRPPHPIPLPAGGTALSRLRGADAAFTDRGVGAAPRGPPPPGRGGGISRRGRAGAAEARSQRRGPGAATCRPLPSLPLPSPSRSAAARPLPGARGAGPRRPPWRRSRRRRAQRGASGSRRP